MMKLFRSGIALLLALVMALSLAACTGNNDATDPTETQGTEPTETTQPTENQGTEPSMENAVTYFNMSLSETYDRYDYINASDDGMGGVYVEYVGDVKKVGSFGPEALNTISAKLAETGLAELNGEQVYEDGEASASMYIEFADGTMLTASYSGTIPQEYLDGYAAMVACFQELTAELEIYVPQAQVIGEVNADALAAMQEILNNSGMEGLDGLMISDVAMDEFFGQSVGLSNVDGITSGTLCSAAMMTTPYSVVIVTLESEDLVQDVRADFETNMGWTKWVCVSPTSALVAQNGNMVICLMGSDTMFQQTATAIENAGWTEITTLDNPNM